MHVSISLLEDDYVMHVSICVLVYLEDGYVMHISISISVLP